MSNGNNNSGFGKEGEEFGLPPGYFKNSAESIMNKIEWQEEHMDLPELLKLKGSTGFSSPNGYFDRSEITLELACWPVLLQAKMAPGFSIPQNYFENAEELSLAAALTGEENELGAFKRLASLKKENNFKISPDYFAANDSQLQVLLIADKQGRLGGILNARFTYAMAALLVIALGLWTYNYYFTPVALKDCGTIACVDKSDLVKIKNLEDLDNEELYELVNPAELQLKLEGDQKHKYNNNPADSGLRDLSTDDLLDEI